MEERLGAFLINSGFKRIDSNVNGIYLFYRVDENDIKIVSIIDMMPGIELSTLQYGHILRQLKDNFADYRKRIYLLNIFFTKEPEKVKHLCTETKEDSHWIIDCSMNRLMIYETQTDDFFGLKGVIEQLLAEEQMLSASGGDEEFTGTDGSLQEPGRERAASNLVLTPVNIIIILLNTAIFVLARYLHVFGDREFAIEKGGLSWYLIKEAGEYYRILTSMFLHSDISHLFSNMLVLLFIGGLLEKVAGRIKYLIIYFGSGIIAAVCSVGYNMWREYGRSSYNGTTISIGASGAIFGVVGAIFFIVIVNRGKLEQISFRQIVLFVILSLYNGYVNSQIDQAAHIGGFLGGLILSAIIYRRKNTDAIT